MPFHSRFQFALISCIILLSTLQTTLALPLLSSDPSKPPFFILVGDSTTAPLQAWKDGKPPGGGGWGDGFLATLSPPAGGVNLGHNGQTTVSYRQKGFWTEVVREVEKRRGGNEVFVTVQFGHNDQKADKGISTAQFEANLEKMVKELRELKAGVVSASARVGYSCYS
jgi:lysophospholipase L1-like esterase